MPDRSGGTRRRGERPLRAVPDLITTSAATAPGGPAAPGTLWGIGQVARYLGRSRETVRTWWEATRTRAADPAKAAAADALPIPDDLLDNTGTDGSAPAPDWWERPGARPLWRPEKIAAWALSTGRAARDGLATYRLPVPMYADLPPLPAPLPRVLDTVAQLPAGRLLSVPTPVHVRVFDGELPETAGGGHRTVVLLGRPDDAALIPHALPELLAAHLLQAGLLTTDQARRALWFSLVPGRDLCDLELRDGQVRHTTRVTYIGWAINAAPAEQASPAPHGELPTLARAHHRLTALAGLWADRSPAPPRLPISDPVTLTADLADVDALVGRPIERYPHGTYTTAVITRYAAGERPVRLDHDPENLAADLTHLPVLAGAAADPHTTPGQAAVYAAAAHWLADIAQGYLSFGYLDPARDPEGRDVVDRRMPTPSDQAEKLIAELLAAEQRPYGIGVLVRDAMAVGSAAAAAAAQAAPTSDGTDDEGIRLAAALAHTAGRISAHYQHQAGYYAAEHRELPVRVPAPASTAEVSGSDEAADATSYLATVSWWGPRPEHRDHAVVLEGLFFDHEHTTGVRYGYDPFGRLVVHCPAAAAFAVAWPLTNDNAAAPGGLALPNPHDLRFVRLPDRRVNLQPMDLDEDRQADQA